MTSTNGAPRVKSFEQLRLVSRSDLPRAEHAVLTQLLIFAGPDLRVRHSEAELARDCRYTERTIRDALTALIEAKILSIIKGHYRDYATVYQLDLTPLQDDPDVTAIEGPDREPEASPQPVPQTGNDYRFKTGNDYRFDPQTGDSFSQTGNSCAPSSIREKTKKNFLAHAPETTKTKPTRPDRTPAPDYLNLPDDFMAWFTAEVPELDLGKEREAFLSHCRRHDITNRSWVGAFKDWLLKAYGLWQRGEPCASHPRPSRQTPAPTPTTGASDGRVSCRFPRCDEPPCPHAPAHAPYCVDHGVCEVCNAALAAANAAWREMMAGEPDPAAASPAVAEPDEVTTVTPEAEGIPVAAVATLVSALARQHTLPLGNPRAGPLGQASPERASPRGWVRRLLAEDDQPTYRALIAQRRARAAQAAPLAAD